MIHKRLQMKAYSVYDVIPQHIKGNIIYKCYLNYLFKLFRLDLLTSCLLPATLGSGVNS